MSSGLVSQPRIEGLKAQPSAETPVKRKRELDVLDEDEWTRQIEAIIERDFFPDLPKLQNKLEWLQVLRHYCPTQRAASKAPVMSLEAGCCRLKSAART